MFRQPQLHSGIRDLLQPLGLDETAGQAADVVRDDRVTVEPAVAVREQAGHWTIDLRAKRLSIRRQLAAAFAPPAGRPSPEQFLAALGALLHLEPFARERGPRLFERGHDAFPPRFPVTRRLVDRLVQPAIVLTPPVAEEVLVGAL